MILDLDQLKPAEKQYYLQHLIAPRPICFAATIDQAGKVNLSPFSFFNLFSTNPPIVIFSPSRRVRDNSTKHTLQNVLDVPEVAINIVTYDMVHQTSLASCEFPKGINEFSKAGFTEEPSTLIRPPMVKESKVKMECRVNEVKALGTEGGAGNLVICEVIRMHIDDALLHDSLVLQQGIRLVDQRKINHVARLGGDWYCRVDASNLFQVEKPNTQLGIGIDALPAGIRQSRVLTGNNLGQLANIQEIPAVDPAYDDDHLKQIMQYYSLNADELERELHLHAQQLLESGNIKAAWQVLLAMI